MLSNTLYKELVKLGFPEKDAKIYLALLELGSARVPEIAQKAGVYRTTTYMILENLQDRGIATSFEKDKKLYFSPVAPENIISFLKDEERNLQEKQRVASQLLPQLTHLYGIAGEKPRVRFFEGKDGIIAMITEFWKTARAKEVYSILPLDDYLTVFTEEERNKLVAEVNKKKIKLRVIYSTQGKPIRARAKNASARFLPHAAFPFSSDIELAGHTVMAVSLRGKLAGVLIESESIAGTLRLLFQLAWEAAGNHSERTKK